MATPKIMTYSFTDYIATFSFVNMFDIRNRKKTKLTFQVGGVQSYLGEMTIARDSANVTRTTSVTGSSVYSFSNNHAGTLSLTMSFVSVAFNGLINLLRKKYLENPEEWTDLLMNIDISDRSGTPVVSLMGCMPERVPDWSVTTEIGTRNYVFQVAQIEEKDKLVVEDERSGE